LATDQFGNQSECSFFITVNRPPVAVNDTLNIDSESDFNSIVVLTNDYDLDGDEISFVSAWLNNDSLSILTTPNGNIEIQVYDNWCGLDSLQYIITDEFGATDSAFVLIDKPCLNGLIIPEGFSPNGDGVNDTFVIKGIEDYPGNSISILNRWVRQVYFSDNYQNDWNGKSTAEYNFGSDLLPEATYFLILDLGDGSEPIRSFVYLSH